MSSMGRFLIQQKLEEKQRAREKQIGQTSLETFISRQPEPLRQQLTPYYEAAIQTDDPMKSFREYGGVDILKSTMESQQKAREAVENPAMFGTPAQKQTAAQELKAGAKKEREFRRTGQFIDQGFDILENAYDTGQRALKSVGIQGGPGRGPTAKAFGAFVNLQGKTGFNKWMKTYKGHLETESIAIMRMFMPGRSKELIDTIKMTLPDLSGVIDEDIAQTIETSTATFGEALASARDKYGDNFKYKTKEEMDRAKDEYRSELIAQYYSRALDRGWLKLNELDPDEQKVLKEYIENERI